MFPAGVILAILGVLLPYDLFNEFGPSVVRSPFFIFTGFLLSGTGLNLLFRRESTTISRIRRALQKPLVNKACGITLSENKHAFLDPQGWSIFPRPALREITGFNRAVA